MYVLSSWFVNEKKLEMVGLQGWASRVVCDIVRERK